MAFQGDSIYWVELEKIVPNPFQPRREFDEQKLRELADSVSMYGILQPLTVTRKEIRREDGTFYTEYELIAGERRLRASKLAGLSQVPVIIREGEDSEQEKLELAIIENLQREDLNAVNRALAFRQLADVFGLPHTQVARKVGRSREYVSNSIRLLGLPDYMQRSLRMGEMTEGHARTLLMINDRPEEQDVVFREILLKKLSVREVERIVRKIATDKVRKKNPMEFDNELIEMEKEFMETLGTRVQIMKTEYGGRLTIDYFSVDDLESMLLRIKSSAPASSKEVQELELEKSLLVGHTPLHTIEPLNVEENDIATNDTNQDLMAASDQSLLVTVPAVPLTAIPSYPEINSEVNTESVLPEPIKADNENSVVNEVTNIEVATAVDMATSYVHNDEEVAIPRLQTEAASPVISINHLSLAPDNIPFIKEELETESYPSVTEPNIPEVAAEVNVLPKPEFAIDQAVPSYAAPQNLPNPTLATLDTSNPTPVVKEESEDDSNLYSIRNFGV